MAKQQMESCLQSEETFFEEKVDLEDLILPGKQVQKVDEELTVEFSDIKQEQTNHFDMFQTHDIDNFKCVSCDASLKHSGQLTTIHITCFKEMLTKVNTMAEKIQDLELRNIELLSNANNLQSTILSIKNEHKTVLSINAQHTSAIVKKQREIKITKDQII